MDLSTHIYSASKAGASNMTLDLENDKCKKCVFSTNMWLCSFCHGDFTSSNPVLRRREGHALNNYVNTFFIDGYMASAIWLKTTEMSRKETCCPISRDTLSD